MSGKSERKRIRKEHWVKYLKENPPEGYDAISKRVNASYAHTQDIRETMKDTGLPFDVVWEMVGMKDEMDCLDTQE
jgi:hypothetical protein